MLDITLPIYNDETEARKHLERILWPEGPVCPHCGVVDEAKEMQGKSHRAGLFNCNACRKPFTVTVGTIFERSKIPLHKWVLATHLMGASKKGVSAHQIHRMLGITYKSAWFMAHRIRESMRELNPGPVGGGGKTVEADETYIGGKRKSAERYSSKEKVISLVERGGKVRSTHVPHVTTKTVRKVLTEQLRQGTHLKTDQAKYYTIPAYEVAASHEVVDHSIGEYVRGEAHTNTIEGYFSNLKRGINGVYHHVSGTHLKRYLGEFDFRYNTRGITDIERTAEALQGIAGKRLTYRRIA